MKLQPVLLADSCHGTGYETRCWEALWPSASATSRRVSRQFDPFCVPSLSAHQIAALQATCQSLQDFLDAVPASAMRQVAEAMLPPAVISHDTSALDLLAMLRLQQNALHEMQTGRFHETQIISLPDQADRVERLLWSPQLKATHLLAAWHCQSAEADERSATHRSLINLATSQQCGS